MTLTQQEKQSLVDLANTARQRAYVPYSNYPVGSSLRTKSGRIFTGVNVENAAYPQTMCAERVAIFKAVSEGEKDFEVIAVVTDNGGSPCGGCRQVMAEFGLDTIVLLADGSGRIIKETTVKELLPDAFTPEHLEILEITFVEVGPLLDPTKVNICIMPDPKFRSFRVEAVVLRHSGLWRSRSLVNPLHASTRQNARSSRKVRARSPHAKRGTSSRSRMSGCSSHGDVTFSSSRKQILWMHTCLCAKTWS
jgi:cytidine deaminase